MIKIKNNQTNKKVFLSFLVLLSLGIIFIISFFILSFVFNSESLTGASVYLEYYGVSDQLLSNHAGKIQTYIKLNQPTLRTLSTSAGRTALAENITETIDFTEDLVKLYQNDPLVPLISGALDIVRQGVIAENNNFKKDFSCMKKIGYNYHNYPQLQLALISELKYQACRNKIGSSFAYVRHTFFNYDNNGFICSQDGEKLFSINKNNGEVSVDVTNC